MTNKEPNSGVFQPEESPLDGVQSDQGKVNEEKEDRLIVQLLEAQEAFERGDYLYSKKILTRMEGENPPEEIRQEMDLLISRMGVDRFAIGVMVGTFVLLLLIVYLIYR